MRLRLYSAAMLGAALALGMSSYASAVIIPNGGPYPGNGASGFGNGGTLGNGSLSITSTPTGTINFSFQPGGTGFTGNDVVIYIDNGSGTGVSDTSTLTPNNPADGGQTAVTGDNNGNSTRTVATFATGFKAQYAISLEPTYAGLFNLTTTPDISGGTSGNVSGSGTGPFTFSYNASELGLAPGDSFNFVASFISTSAYRSNETIGTSVTTPGSAGDAPNAGFTGTTVFSDFDTYKLASPIPEPASLSLLAVAGAGLLGMRRRRA